MMITNRPAKVIKFIGMRGLGDNIYQRAFLKQFSKHDVYLETPWPQIYSDMPYIKCVKSTTDLRTQKKNVNTLPDDVWHTANMRGAKTIAYGAAPILAGLQSAFGVKPGVFDLPPLAPPRVKPYALIRPVTVRSEWRADSRNCLPEYVAECSEVLYNEGLEVISVADLQSGAEWLVEPAPYADQTHHNGELSILELLSLVMHAYVVVGPVGWIVPACIAARTPAWIISGGQGGFNAPNRICPNWASWVEFAVPDNFCDCRMKMHECDKRISNHAAKFADMVSRAGHGLSSSAAN